MGRKLKTIFNKLSKIKKTNFIIFLIVFLFLLISIPTFARYKNRISLNNLTVWDGNIATAYHGGTGTVNDPYVISNGAELAYFSSQLSTNDYVDTYFLLSNDIILNGGVFGYNSSNKITYVLNNNTYYIKPYTNEYYNDDIYTGNIEGTINLFHSLNNFKGTFDANSHTIHGLYVADANNIEVSLFTNLHGNIQDLYVTNAMIYGGNITGGIASHAVNSTIKNTSFNGYVIGKNSAVSETTNVPLATKTITTSSTENVNIPLPFISGEIISTSLTGNCNINGNMSVNINGTALESGEFNISLGDDLLNSIIITTTSSDVDSSITLDNLSYNIIYNMGISGGIIGILENTTIEKTINKGTVYGHLNSGGLVGYATGLASINYSYNSGLVSGTNDLGGLVGTIENSNQNIILTNSYNSGDGNNALVGSIINNTQAINISNVFNATNASYAINNIINSTVNVTNSYIVSGVNVNNGTLTNNFSLTSLNNLQTKSYIINNLEFNEFIDYSDLLSNPNNIWVYEDGLLPILFLDDIRNPIASIHAGNYSWNNLSYELNNIKFSTNITMAIEQLDNLKKIKNIYYYINNSNIPLTKNQIESLSNWNSYTDIVQISNEGFYIIYAKIVDINNNVIYLNTDILVLDLSGSTVNINIDDKNWNTASETLQKYYIDSEKSFTVTATDDLSGIKNIQYYISNNILTSSELDTLDSWENYNDGILISSAGTYIIYVKVIDNCDFITYVNTDYIVFDGYNQNYIKIGRNGPSNLSNNYITNDSVISLSYTYTNLDQYLTGYNHKIISNILLPMGSKITLIDHIRNEFYEYIINTNEDLYNYHNSCVNTDVTCVKKATYPLSLFNKVGSITQMFDESIFVNNQIDENFEIILDLTNTNITNNYNDVYLSLGIFNDYDSVIPTLYSTIKKFSIYSKVNNNSTKANLYITTTYDNTPIILNSDSSTDIPLNTGLIYKYISSNKIYDTTYDDKKIGIIIKLLDNNGSIVTKDKLKNIVFKVGNQRFYPDNDSVLRINLGTGIIDTTKTITIVTYSSNVDLPVGNYSLEITNYVSYDGIYSNSTNPSKISIPAIISNNVISNNKYSFDVLMDDSIRIIDKGDSTTTMNFNILQKNSLTNPNIKVALYKKNVLSATNQEYVIVDLADYISNSLEESVDNVYFVSSNPVNYNGSTVTYNNLSLSLLKANFESNGYKFRFTLCDGNKEIGVIEKYFIIK